MTCLDFQIRHTFKSGFVLDVQFQAGDGVTALFGPSGSGKSTTLAVIAGILAPQQGRVKFNDRVLLDTVRKIHAPPEVRRVGFVFQDRRLFPHLSVADNLRYGARRGAAQAVELADVVDVLELGNHLDRHPNSLSGGEQQRVAIGRALLHGPELLLLDEPLTALDAAAKHRIAEYLERIVDRWQIPTLLVSHDQTDVRRLAKEIVIICAGRVVSTGPTGQTLDEAMVSGRLPAAAPLNLLRVEHVRITASGAEGDVGDQTFRLPRGTIADRKRVMVSFQPTDVTLSRHPLAGISIRNQLSGTVSQIVERGELSLVRVDIGQTVWAEVTTEAVAELQLAIGCEVTCLVKAAAVQSNGE